MKLKYSFQVKLLIEVNLKAFGTLQPSFTLIDLHLHDDALGFLLTPNEGSLSTVLLSTTDLSIFAILAVPRSRKARLRSDISILLHKEIAWDAVA